MSSDRQKRKRGSKSIWIAPHPTDLCVNKITTIIDKIDKLGQSTGVLCKDLVRLVQWFVMATTVSQLKLVVIFLFVCEQQHQNLKQ